MHSLNEELKSLSITLDETDELEGILTGYDTERKTFSFSYGSTTIKGKLDSAFICEKYLVPSNRCAKIRTVKIYDAENDKSKPSYYLVSLKDVN